MKDGELDPQIAPYVTLLNQNGVETFESCQGGKGHAFQAPTIRFHGGKAEGWKALSVAMQHAFPIEALRRVWDIIDNEPSGGHWEMVLVKSKL